MDKERVNDLLLRALECTVTAMEKIEIYDEDSTRAMAQLCHSVAELAGVMTRENSPAFVPRESP